MKHTHTIEWYRDSEKGHRWRIRARNCRIICASSEGYKRRMTARRALDRLLTAIQDGAFETVDPLYPSKEVRK